MFTEAAQISVHAKLDSAFITEEGTGCLCCDGELKQGTCNCTQSPLEGIKPQKLHIVAFKPQRGKSIYRVITNGLTLEDMVLCPHSK